ncbi:unnamed protein product [Phyllotreta striolata]|uniref:Uncharacterized protein n=1 Tax=Phyllotreta striolata TaxID=444603 RepID=A0A9P0DXS1_PHYSR|nr:unnamed protein product [Phyllotreta striolata]
MSRNSSKGRSDGDPADSYYTDYPDVKTNDCLSYRNIEGGPYGDIPPEPNERGFYRDYVVFMLEEDGDYSRENSDENDEKELYNLRNEYIQKLNIVRRRLNLAEIANDGDKYFQSAYQRKCTITEIVEDDEQKPEHTSEQHCSSKTQELPQARPRSSPSSTEIQTIYPFSLRYTKIEEADSLSNILDMEYNPPKKKSCYRLKTPKMPSASESNIPYRTKISLHDGLFKSPSEKRPEKRPEFDMEMIEKFTVTREIQCELGSNSDGSTRVNESPGRGESARIESEYESSSCLSAESGRAEKSTGRKYAIESSSAGYSKSGSSPKNNPKEIDKESDNSKYMKDITQYEAYNNQCKRETEYVANEKYTTIKPLSANITSDLSSAKQCIREMSELQTRLAGLENTCRNYNLFPQVIVKYESSKHAIASSRYTPTSSSAGDCNSKDNVNHPNFVAEDSSSRGGYEMITTSTTILDDPPPRAKKKEACKRRKFAQLKRPRPVNSKHLGDGGAGDVNRREEYKGNVVAQYAKYREERRRSKSRPAEEIAAPAHLRSSVVVDNLRRSWNADGNFYYFNSSSCGSSSRPGPSSSTDAKRDNGGAKWTGSLFSCFRSLLSCFRRKKTVEE